MSVAVDHRRLGPASAGEDERTVARAPAIGGQHLNDFVLERFTPGSFGPKSAYEHWSRYLFALRYVEGREVLDYGCGSGFGSRAIAASAAHVLAVDVSADAVAYARDHYAHPRCRFEHCASPGALATASCDVILCFEVIEHVHDQDALLGEFARVLRPGGLLLASTPDPRYTATLGENPFHVRELQREEFLGLLAGHFAHQQIFAQTPIVGEGISPDGEAPGAASAALDVIAYDQVRNSWDPSTGLPGEPQTWVVVASDRALPPPRALVVSDRDGRFLHDLREYIDRLEAERRALTAALEGERTQAADALSAERARHAAETDAERERHAASVERERAERAAERGELDSELAQRRQELAATREELDSARLALEQSESDMRQLRYDVMYLESKVGIRWVVWAVRGTARRLRRLLKVG